MPSTITTYKTFVAGTKARASDFNTNFSNYRGDLIPINELTQTASDLTHNLGASDHRWNILYGSQINLNGSTSTVHTVLKSQTSVTAGAAELLFGSNTATVFGPDYIKVKGATATHDTVFKVNQGVTTGSVEIVFGGSLTSASFDINGLKHRTKGAMEFTTTSAPIGTALYLVNPTTTISDASSTGNTISAGRITTRGGGIVQIDLIGKLSNTSGNDNEFAVDFYRGVTTTSLSIISTKTFFVQEASANAYIILDSRLYDNSYTAGEVCYQSIIRSLASPGVGIVFTGSTYHIIREL